MFARAPPVGNGLRNMPALPSRLSAPAAPGSAIEERLASSGPPLRLRAAPSRLARAARSPFARVNTQPVIVLGNQKAGTSAIAALLAAATRSSVTLDLRNEQTAHPTFVRCRLGHVPFAELVRRNRLDFSRDIVKEPNLSLLYDDLVGYFPRVRTALVVRDPRDNIRSQLNWLRLPGDLAAVDERHRRTLTTVQRSVLDAGWLGLPGANYVDALARRWNAVADVYLRHSERVRLVRYEDFCRDKVATVGRLAAELGMAAVRDISADVDRQYQPRGDRSASWPEFFGPENLARITTRCAERMRMLEYTRPGRTRF
jgi:hypothetical protein